MDLRLNLAAAASRLSYKTEIIPSKSGEYVLFLYVKIYFLLKAGVKSVAAKAVLVNAVWLTIDGHTL